MKNLLRILVFISVVIHGKGAAQPTPFDGTLLFNLNANNNDPYSSLTPEDLKKKNISFFTTHPSATLKYDTIYKAFSITTYGNEIKDFAVVYNRDTIYIKYPSRERHQPVFIKTPIPLNGKSYSFYNEFTYDAIHSNEVETKVFELCQGCFISQYEMPDKMLGQIKLIKGRRWFLLEFKD